MPDYQKLSEADLIGLAKSQDRNAFAEIVNRFQKQIGSYFYKLSGNYPLRDDLTQDCFIKAWHGIGRFQAQGKATFLDWLYRIAHNLWVDYVKSPKNIRTKQMPADTKGTEEQIGAVGESDTYNDEKTEEIRSALAQLSDEHREIIELFYDQELSYEEISRKLKIPFNTVKSRLKWAKKRLQENL